MNYRHHFHAGNYADVFKHVLLLSLIRAMQRKEKGFLYLDTHAGRGGYDLEATTALPDGRERVPEWPQGIGRIWGDTSGPLAAYFSLVLQFNLERGGDKAGPRYYPGSPWVASHLARQADRLALCELREDDAEALRADFRAEPNASVHAMDGYTALRAMLPPPEKRALVLIDPPFENAGEFISTLDGLREALRRFPSGVYAVWYPLTERARAEEFHQAVRGLATPALAAELNIAGDGSPLRMKGCGLLVLNPPWQIEGDFAALLPALVERLQVDHGATGRCAWVVPEK